MMPHVASMPAIISILESDQLAMQVLARIAAMTLACCKELARLLGRLSLDAPLLSARHLHGCVEQLQITLSACRHCPTFLERIIPSA
jgi:hypothetical protein